VRILPSGHEFDCSGHQSFLQAALEQGINLHYGCETGNCGDCLATLVDGEIAAIRFSDYLLTPQQKADRRFLTCINAPGSDCVIRADEVGSPREIPEQHIEARVYRMERLSDDVMQVSLKTPRSQPLQFLAGQHVTVDLGNGLSRNKSIASCPCDGLKPEIHVKHRPGDPFSEHVFDRLKKNDRVSLTGPWGDFVLDDDTTRPLVFVAYDTGFASIKSLIEHAIALEKPQDIHLYWVVTPNHTPYRENYCRSIEDALDNVRYFPIAIREPSDECIDAVMDKILGQEAAVKFSDVYVTMPERYRGIAAERLQAAGIDDRHWRIDTLVRL
jgi:CDP-4-dehydro-6-deoxyglucose reductase